jgi:hypothetical protein
MTDIHDLFPETYEDSRARFRQDLSLVKSAWPEAHLESHTLNGSSEDLTIDWIQADARENQQKLLVFTTGEHGIEAFTGSAALQLFLEEFLPRLNPATTGLLLVHAINPWGMKHRRRVNRNNVDLNRNFGWEAGRCHLSVNPDYDLLNPLLNPRQPLKNRPGSGLLFYLQVLRSILRIGQKRFVAATLLGQYCFPRGIYYGGGELQEETGVLTDLYTTLFPQFQQILHLDMHTGYGPSHPMTLVNSSLEPAGSKDLARAFEYPRVRKSSSAEFYSIQGDMIDFEYALAVKELPGRPFYATSFEFGTFGDSPPASLRSLHAMILENQAYWTSPPAPEVQSAVDEEFTSLFAPSSSTWRSRAMQDARQAIQGILKARGYLET